MRSRDVLDEHDRAARFQHPHDFTKRLTLVRDATEHQSADDRVHAGADANVPSLILRFNVSKALRDCETKQSPPFVCRYPTRNLRSMPTTCCGAGNGGFGCDRRLGVAGPDCKLWCFRGQPPSDKREVELIVCAFKFTPL